MAVPMCRGGSHESSGLALVAASSSQPWSWRRSCMPRNQRLGKRRTRDHRVDIFPQSPVPEAGGLKRIRRSVHLSSQMMLVNWDSETWIQDPTPNLGKIEHVVTKLISTPTLVQYLLVSFQLPAVPGPRRGTSCFSVHIMPFNGIRQSLWRKAGETALLLHLKAGQCARVYMRAKRL
jgi:hypothetical protein